MSTLRWPRSMAALVALLLLFAPTAVFAQEAGEETPAPTESIEIDNAAEAVNTTDGTSVFDLAFDVVTVIDGIVDQTNVALAYSSCNSCSTFAVAIQVVLVAGEATVVEPQNVALAINYECNACEAFATAYQFVIGVPVEWRFTGEGRSGLAHIYNEVRSLWASVQDGSLAVEDFFTQLDVQMQALWSILKNEIVVRGDEGAEEGEGATAETDSGDPAETSPSPSPSTSVSPSPEPTPEGDDPQTDPTEPAPSPSPST